MRDRLKSFPWSRYRTQIVVAVVAVTAIVLVFRGATTQHPPAGLDGAATGLAASAGNHGTTTAGTASPSASASASPSAAADSPEPVDPALFAPGACVAYPPVNGNRDITVFLDAGHGGLDPGGVGETMQWHTITEAWVNLRVEMDAMTMLTQQGYRVVVSRSDSGLVHPLGPGDSDDDMLTPLGLRADIAARDVCANMGDASLLVGIYMNAGYWGGGSVTAYDDVRAFAAGNHRFAGILQQDVLHELNSRGGYDIPNLGLQTDDQLGSSSSAAADSYGHLMLLGPAKSGYFSTPSRMTGALIEPLFLTDPFEASVAASARGQSLIAEGISHAVMDYSG